jgi:hypothetical protein
VVLVEVGVVITDVVEVVEVVDMVEVSEVIELVTEEVAGLELQAPKDKTSRTRIRLEIKSNILGCPFFTFSLLFLIFGLRNIYVKALILI